MTEAKVKEYVEYWWITAANDKKTLDALYKSKRYDAALFFGHIILEKILKALVVENTKGVAPFIHDLVRLESLTAAGLSPEEKDLLDEVNEFNIRARYPEDKFLFFKRCTKAYVDQFIPRIITLYEKLCQKVKQKK